MGWQEDSQKFFEKTNVAKKITKVDNIFYIAISKVGTLESEALWQAKKVVTGDDIKITWADGDDNFDNIATDLTSLSYI